MNFLKPEPKPFNWKSALKSDEFMRLVLMILLAGILITFMVVLVARWQELFPTPTKPTHQELPITLLDTSAVTPTLPASVSITLTPPTLIPVPFEGRLDKIEDYTPIKQDEPFNFLLEYISNVSPEEISKYVNHDLKYSDLMEHPEKYRGEFVRAKGYLLFSPHTGNLTDNPAGLKIYYAVWLGKTNQDEIYHFILIDKPQKHVGVYDPGQPDLVWVEGAFLKLEKYERASRAGGGYKIAPLLIGRRMGDVPQPPISTQGVTTLKFVMGGLMALALLIIVIAIIITARRNKAHQIRQKERWRKRISTDSTKKPEP